MIDISNKALTLREATAQAILKISPSTVSLLKNGRLPKKDPLATARVAAVQGAKATSSIIPFCHPLPITFVGVEFEVREDSIISTVTVKAIHSTGVEMEALTGASVAVLTLYDMLKAVDTSMEIAGVRLLDKKGGKTEHPRVFQRPTKIAVIVVSDSASKGEREDSSGKAIKAFLEERGGIVEEFMVVPDEAEEIRAAVEKLVEERIDLVVSSGGTGIGPRDVTPEALSPLLDKELSGIAETIRAYGQTRTPYACLSRTVAGVAGSTVILALPGSPKAVVEGLTAVFPALVHSLEMIEGKGH